MIFLVQVLCKQHDLPASEALAVAHIESRTKYQEFRLGPMGKGTYGGPFGIRNCFPGWDDPAENCAIGVRALARLKKKKGSLKGALKVYNAEFSESYWEAVQSAIRKYSTCLAQVE